MKESAISEECRKMFLESFCESKKLKEKCYERYKICIVFFFFISHVDSDEKIRTAWIESQSADKYCACVIFSSPDKIKNRLKWMEKSESISTLNCLNNGYEFD